MTEVTVRDLRNQGGRILERVEAGETLTVTRDGRPVAELRPLPARPLSAQMLLKRWRGLPRIDWLALRADLDALVDASL